MDTQVGWGVELNFGFGKVAVDGLVCGLQGCTKGNACAQTLLQPAICATAPQMPPTALIAPRPRTPCPGARRQHALAAPRRGGGRGAGRAGGGAGPAHVHTRGAAGPGVRPEVPCRRTLHAASPAGLHAHGPVVGPTQLQPLRADMHDHTAGPAAPVPPPPPPALWRAYTIHSCTLIACLPAGTTWAAAPRTSWPATRAAGHATCATPTPP